MEIPYIVTPRKDTGLFNSKIAIWLFLASEVMLFGGFFSAYVFLRLGADYPWPERALPVIPGLINTFILIASSVTVVFAWAALKMREWRKFQLFMSITVACAATFMVLKSIEYNVKFHHQAIRLTDYTIIEGHLSYKEEKDHHGRKVEENLIHVATEKLTFDTVRVYKPWVEELLSQASHRNAKITLANDLKAITSQGGEEEIIANAGEELSTELLAKIKKLHLAARTNNAEHRTASLREQWAAEKEANPGKKGWELAPYIAVDTESIAPHLMTEVSSVTFNVTPAVVFDFGPRDIKPGDAQSSLRDGTVVVGKLQDSPMVFHYVDAIDFQYLAMKAVEKGVDPMVAIENSWLLQNDASAREAWEWHKEQIATLEKELLEKGGVDKSGNPKLEPTLTERYRIGWKGFVAKADGVRTRDAKITVKEQFFGPDYAAREAKHTFSHLDVPREQISFSSKFTPSWNTFYALYFTITGLHGLHVIGGALVLGYYLFFGRKMYLANPEWLANRVEVGGLFWHFVDLVWIFVFPIFYLM
ncbi:MAG: cytochrome c oxidase subunit 3 [Luteolibacter sp.]